MYNSSYICENFARLPQVVRIRGICPALDFFTVDFLSPTQDSLLHIKVFSNDRRLVMNSFVKKVWGEEAKFDHLDLEIGAPIDLVLLLTGSGVLILFNDRVLNFYLWRAPISNASVIHVEGIDAALFRSGPWSEPARAIEIAPTNMLDPDTAQSLIGKGNRRPTIVNQAVLASAIKGA